MTDTSSDLPTPWQPQLPDLPSWRRDRSGDATATCAAGRRRSGPPGDRAYAAAGLAIVADGVGGSADGGLAADVVVGTLVRELACAPQLDIGTIDKAIRLAATTLAAADVDGATTVTVGVVVTDGHTRKLLLGWAGDSPAALLRREALFWLTLPDAEDITPNALIDPSVPPRAGSRLTSALRGGLPVTPNLLVHDLEPGDVIILGSDGLLDHRTDPRDRLPVRGPATAQAFVLAALAEGAGDDTTAAVLAPDGLTNLTPHLRSRPARRRWFTPRRTTT